MLCGVVQFASLAVCCCCTPACVAANNQQLLVPLGVEHKTSGTLLAAVHKIMLGFEASLLQHS